MMEANSPKPAFSKHPSRIYVHVISDATGTGAERMARAALVQFRKRLDAKFIRHSFVKNTKQLSRILQEAEVHQGVVVYTVTDKKLRGWLEQQQYDRSVEMIDMLGPMLRRIGRRFQTRPLLNSGLLPGALGDKALRLAQCIDFTLEHDDGKGVETMGQADIVLLGVSRTNKTPTSIYLCCHQCVKVANVPLALGVEPPKKIFSLKKPRMVGFTIAPEKLAHVRRNRFKEGVPEGYFKINSISEELAYAWKIFDHINKIKVIDVTNRTIEEIANLIT
jgi:regulator of PEP synthase PpsR (kinase-PPPase family)